MNAREASAKRIARIVTTIITISAVSTCLVALYVLFYRPIFMTFMIGTLVFIGYYFLSFNTIWHRSQYMENTFWSCTGSLLVGTMFFTTDSPFRLINSYSTDTILALICVIVLFSTVSSQIDKYFHNASLVVTDAMKKNQSAASLFMDHDESFLQRKKILEENMEILDARLLTFWDIGSINKAEQKIIEVYREADRRELKHLIVNYPLRKVLFKLENTRLSTTLHSSFLRRITATGNKKRFLELLSVERVHELGITARYYIIDAIQSIRLTSDATFSLIAQETIKNILLDTRLEQLSELKTRIDNKGSVLSTHHLLFKDVTDKNIREKIFDHINKEAYDVRIRFTHVDSGKSLHRRPWRKILCDIDDTTFSSGGRYPAGSDTTYPYHALYPGALAFFKELDLGSHDYVDQIGGVWPEGQPGNLCFLSARPHVYKDVMERSVFKKFKFMIQNKLLHATPMLLPGDIQSGQSFVLRGDLAPMAKKKYDNFKEYASIYPEFMHIFVGDTGQADAKAAEMMLESFPKKMRAVFMHQISPIEESYGYSPKWKKILFFSTYVHAALIAHKKGLITLLGMIRVCRAIKPDFNRIDWFSEDQKEAARVQLNKDIETVNTFLKQKQGETNTRLRLIDPLLADQRYPTGSIVHTKLGKGVIEGFEPIHNIYAININMQLNTPGDRSRSESFSSALSFPKSPILQAIVPPLLMNSTALFNIKGYFNVNEIDPSKRALDKKSKLKIKFYLGVLRPKEDDPFDIGKEVQTPFGIAVIRKLRAYEKIYELETINSGLKLYMHENRLKNEVSKFSYSYTEGLFSLLGLSNTEKQVELELPEYRSGAVIETPYGQAKITETYVQYEQPFLKILFSWGGTGCLPKSNIEQFKAEKEAKQEIKSAPSKSILRSFSILGAPKLSSIQNVVSRLISWSSSAEKQGLYRIGATVLTSYGYGTVLDTQIRLEVVFYSVGLSWGKAKLWIVQAKIDRELSLLEIHIFDKLRLYSVQSPIKLTKYGPGRVAGNEIQLFWTKESIRNSKPSAILYLGEKGEIFES